MSKRKFDDSAPADSKESVPAPQRSKHVILSKRHYTTGTVIKEVESKHEWTHSGPKCDHQCALLPKGSVIPLLVLEALQETPFSEGDTTKTISSVQCVTADGMRTELRLTIPSEQHMATAKVRVCSCTFLNTQLISAYCVNVTSSISFVSNIVHAQPSTSMLFA
jgi:hypothetical protein